MLNRKLFGAILIIVSVVCLAAGHDTWLLARRSVVSPGSTVTFDLTSGMTFPVLDTSIKPDRVGVAKVRLNNKTFDISAITSGPKSLLLRAPLNDTGVATVWVELKPRTLELKPAQVKEYFAEIDASPEIRKAWSESTTKRWRESYVKHSKSFVQVGKPVDDRSWTEPVGMSLEIVPEQNPMELKVGDKLRVRVLQNGAPQRDFPLGIVRAWQSHGTFQTTDQEGRAEFKLTRKGKWMLRGTQLRKSTDANLDWESDFTTLTIEVN
jgi:uncharacterized GH25 family protein